MARLRKRLDGVTLLIALTALAIGVLIGKVATKPMEPTPQAAEYDR
jgi:hypothetical protein